MGLSVNEAPVAKKILIAHLTFVTLPVRRLLGVATFNTFLKGVIQ